MVTNKFSKKKSKRMTCSQKYKIAKKVREHNRKVRKGIIKKKGKRSKKDPGVPNLAPFKEKVLEEAELDRRNAIALKQKRKQEQREKRKSDKSGALDALVEQANNNSDQFESAHDANSTADGSAKAFYKEFKKVVEEADVIIEVLDARDPLGTRSSELEQTVLSAGSGKRLVLLLNKADLVPRENLKNWVKYLRGEYPTLAFKSSTQRQTSRLAQSSVEVTAAPRALLQSHTCLGAAALLQLLAKYCRGGGGGVTVGLVGLPNVGKSSVINSLKRARSCGVGGRPGVTRSLQTVRLDSHVQLLDTPGLVLTSGGENSLALRGAVSAQRVSDPLLCVQTVLGRLERCQLMLHYRLPEFSDTAHMLALLARRQGRLKAGGVVDVEAAARAVLHDWNTGRISYHTSVPARADAGTAQLVSQMSDPLPLLDEDLEGMYGGSVQVLPDDGEQMEAGGADLVVQLETDVPDDVQQVEDRTRKVTPTALRLSATSDGGDMALSKKTFKQMAKKRRKMQARNVRKVDALSNQLSEL